ncbi:T6SS immunity protein Tli4 family protein [Roseateles koreensis]|uniref:T6SS immunity protein Tli4 family protein n=1 Tax=Roseateles koreensis TaxID=2987526 RepID=A0ABT5KU76_9BURK|nr:T6SS immunity protein Tli4 family protein [Roseateles koreensis]MDC8785317.1 T6SS immunity protein Tli4 family protein [Roseateles koreensis]
MKQLPTKLDRIGAGLSVLCRWALLPLAAMASACSAEPPPIPTDWKTDCVGLMQISFPGEVDVAAHKFRKYSQFSTQANLSESVFFSDGKIAGGDDFWYHGTLQVTHPMTDDEYKALVAARKDSQKEVLADFKKKKPTELNAAGQRSRYWLLQTTAKDGVAWRFDADYVVLMRVNQSVISWVSAGSRPNIDKAEKSAAIAFNNLNQAQPRPLYDLPKNPGLCLPYLFIQDSEPAPDRSFGVTYRLKEHPDITIFLQDIRANTPVKSERDNRFAAIDRAENFWGLMYRQSYAKADVQYLNFSEFAGYKAVASKAYMVRQGGEKDYGLMYTVLGHEDESKDVPNLTFRVIRDAKNAIAKGIEPVPEKAFFEMAQTIANSVKRRSVKQRAIEPQGTQAP